ncbi:hypothetical protein DPEC_G00312010 [Dallia pectoralis]|uniref:Uncharacterized protein n=1 Tax=Dallia pectoralis TaxID=75939 RepID=A0ACC2FBG5_DALPE|nr:hypothetical protein DPEC_G00312010 [Dallia pectoralis]
MNWSTEGVCEIQSSRGPSLFSGLTVAYIAAEVVIAVLSTVGNTLVCMAVTRNRKLRTVTNYFLVSLSVADIFVGVLAIPCAVLTDLGMPHHNLPLCLALLSVLIVLTQSSILSLLAVAVDRYVAILLPFQYQRIMSPRNTRVALLLTWSLALLSGAIPLMGWHRSLPPSGTCWFPCVVNMSYMVYFNFIGCVLVPLVVMFVIYGHIFLAVRRQLRRIAAGRAPAATVSRNNGSTAGGSCAGSSAGCVRDRSGGRSRGGAAGPVTVGWGGRGLAAPGGQRYGGVDRNGAKENAADMSGYNGTYARAGPGDGGPRDESVVTGEPRDESVATTNPGPVSGVTGEPRDESVATTNPGPVSGVTGEPRDESVATTNPGPVSGVTGEPRRWPVGREWRPSRRMRGEVRKATSLFLLVFLFMLCWLPIHCVNCVSLLMPRWHVPKALSLAAILLSHANSALNPLLYAYRMRSFRQTLRDLCRRTQTS